MPGVPAGVFDVDLSVDAALVAIGAAVVSALTFGLLPVRGLTRTNPGKSLQAYGSRQTYTKGVRAFRAALATVQIALSMTLLVITGVFAQSLANLARIDLGLDLDSVVTFTMAPETSGYSPAEAAQLFDRLEGELVAIPGVTSAASAMLPVLASLGVNFNAASDGADGRFAFSPTSTPSARVSSRRSAFHCARAVTSQRPIAPARRASPWSTSARPRSWVAPNKSLGGGSESPATQRSSASSPTQKIAPCAARSRRRSSRCARLERC